MIREASPWLTTKEAARRGRVSRNRLYAAIAAGQLKAVRVGARTWRFHVEWLDAWLDASATVINPDAPGAAVAPFRRG